MTLVLCPICRQLLRPALPGWGTAQNELPAGWDCASAHAASTPPDAYEAARLHWLAHDQALQPHIHDPHAAAASELARNQGMTAEQDPGPIRRGTP